MAAAHDMVWGDEQNAYVKQQPGCNKGDAMKQVTRWQASDGSVFSDEAKCREHDALCEEVAAIMSALPPRPSGSEYANGRGFIQHNPAVFWAARESLLRLGKRLCPHKWFDQAIADRNIHPDWCGRLFGEIGEPLYSAWLRVWCTDKSLREWGQPYYAAHPNEVLPADAICLNAK